MFAIVPVLLAGAWVGASFFGHENGGAGAHLADAERVVPFVAGEDAGAGAYLKGAVADLDGRPALALAGYKAALADDPDNMELRVRTQDTALLAGGVEDAVRLAKTLPETEQTVMVRLTLLADAAKKGKLEAAKREAVAVGKVSPELVQFDLLDVYVDYALGVPVAELVDRLQRLKVPAVLDGRRNYHIARLWLKAGEPEKALTALETAAREEPNAVTTTLLLADTLARQGRPDAAAAVLERFRAANPSLAMLVPEGKVLAKEMPPAFASTLSEDEAAVLEDFGLLVWAQGAYGPARQVLNLTLWLDPTRVRTRYYLGMLLESGGDGAAAQAQYQALLVDGVPQGVQLAARVRLMERAFAAGDEKAAWREGKALAAEHPDNAAVLRSVAQMAYLREDFKAAANYYGGLLALAPEGKERAELLFSRGVAYERAGEVDKAAADLQASLAIDPAQAQVLNYLGYMWADRGEHMMEAFDLLQRAHTLAPEDGSITDSLGWAYFKKGDYASARAYLERAVEQEPNSPEIYDHLGDVYAALGDAAKGAVMWRKALDLAQGGAEVPDAGFLGRVRAKVR